MITNLKNILLKTWPFLLIIFLVGVFFWKFFLKGLIPLPADLVIGAYYPWLDYKWGYEVGVPVKNPLIADSVSQFYPFKIYAMEQIKEGFLPLWNSSLFGGCPLFSNVLIGILNPTNLLFVFLPKLTAWGLQTSLQPLLAAFFTYLFLRSFNLGKFSSIAGAIIYAFCGFNIMWMELNIHGFTAAFLPLIFYSINKFYHSKNILFLILTSLAICLQIFSGYPQIIIYSFLTLIFYVFWVFGVPRKENLLVFSFVALGIILASVQIVPTIELFLNSQRRLESLPFDQVYLPWSYIISFFAPDYYGNPVTGNFWGKTDYTAICGYCGIVSVVLAGTAFSWIKKKKIVSFFIVLLFFTLALAFPTPLMKLFYKGNFFGLGASGASRILFLSCFSIASLSAFGFEILLNHKFEKKYLRALYLPLIILGGFGVGTLLSIAIVKYASRELAQEALIYLDKFCYGNLKVGMRNLVLPSLVLSSMILALAALNFKNRITKKASLILIFLVLILELFRFGWKFLPFTKPDLVYPETPVITFLKEKQGIFRVEGGDAIPMNMLMPYGIDTFSAYDPMYPLRTAEMISLVDGGSILRPKDRYAKINNYHSRLLDLSNICYLLSVKKDDRDRVSIEGRPGYQFRLDKFSVIFSDKSVDVLKNKDCFPRAFLVRDYIISSSKEEIAQFLQSKDFDLKKTIILEKNPGVISLKTETSKEDKLVWRVQKPGFNEIEVDLKEPAFIFLSENYYPGWKAFVDDQKTEVFRADYAFQSVYVPSGKHLVKFVYSPVSFKIGIICSGLAATVLFVLLLSKRKKTITGY
ncbi:hypothetical protein C4578_01105 [Candidatus Microgenomates bacterium]|jgi:hypothetical protein|nr:MAG: hypothetical protein C4578_01105 [Candidatus Microgenomates bacterium]